MSVLIFTVAVASDLVLSFFPSDIDFVGEFLTRKYLFAQCVLFEFMNCQHVFCTVLDLGARGLPPNSLLPLRDLLDAS